MIKISDVHLGCFLAWGRKTTAKQGSHEGMRSEGPEF